MPRLLITTLVLFSLGCSASEKPETTKQETPTSVTQVVMRDAANMLVSGFMVDLKTELMSAMKKGGAVNAISACQIKAPKIADGFSGAKWSIRRVTTKPSNQANKANTHEQEILGLFSDTLKQLEFFDEWADSENKTGYTYYRPIKMGRFCLKCHGDSKKIDEEVTLALRDKYPKDQATDYSAGDLRGMFVVAIEKGNDLNQLKQSMRDSL